MSTKSRSSQDEKWRERQRQKQRERQETASAAQKTQESVGTEVKHPEAPEGQTAVTPEGTPTGPAETKE